MNEGSGAGVGLGNVGPACVPYDILEGELGGAGLQKRFKAKVSGSVVDSEVERELSAASRSAAGVRVKGFSAGKAVPEALLRSLVDSEVRDKAVERIARQVCDDFCNQNALRMDGEASFRAVEMKPDLVLELVIPTMPSIAVPDVGSISVCEYKCVISDEDIEKEYSRLVAGAKWPVPCDEPAELGDSVDIEVSALTSDGKTVAPLCLKRTVKITADRDSVLLDVIPLIVGMSNGGTKEVSMVIPGDYPVKSFRGRDVTVKLSISGLHRETATNDEEAFLRKIRCASKEAAGLAIRKSLESRSAGYVLALQRKEIEDKLSESADFVVPDGAVEEQLARMGGAEGSEITDKMREDATRAVKLVYSLAAYADKHGIAIDYNDINRAFEHILTGNPIYDKALVRFYRNNAAALDNLKAGVQAGKIVAHMLGLTQKVETVISFDELVEAHSKLGLS